MDMLTDIRRPIEADMQAYRRLFESTLTTDNPLLQLALDHLLRRQGKMMRPILVMLAARYVATGDDGRCRGAGNTAYKANDEVLHAAVALELLHTASLVHDDVVDESNRRRGQKSVNALLDNKAAVLVGDFLLSKALFHAAATSNTNVVRWVAELGQTLSDGELLQLANIDKREVSEADYYNVIRKKTASLFATCAKVGALLAGGTTEETEALEKYGESVGICFQIRDDIMDYDHNNDTGKPSGNDMREGKLTLPLIHALLSTDDRNMFTLAMKVREGEATTEDISTLVGFTLQQGGIDYARSAMDDYAQRAVALLPTTADRDEQVADALGQYVGFVTGRNL